MGLGCLIGGVVADWLGYSATFWATVAVNALGVAGFFGYAMRHFQRHKLR